MIEITTPTPTEEAPTESRQEVPGEAASGATAADEVATDGGDRRPRRTGPPTPGPVSIALALVMVASVTVAFFGAFALGLSGLQEQRSQHELYASLRGLLSPSSPVAPYIGGSIPSGAPLLLLDAPRANVHDTVVVEGTSSSDLLAGPGHQADTPLPGQAGIVVILGKAATAGAPFSRITDLRRGDVISARTGQGLFHYRVQGQLSDGGRLPTIPSTGGLLVLGTSAGSGSLGNFTAGHVVYVYARLVGRSVPAPRGKPHSVPTSQLPGQGDPGALPYVLLWGVALVVASGACWWLWSYWGILRTWLVGAPVLFALLWALSDEALRLFPNIY